MVDSGVRGKNKEDQKIYNDFDQSVAIDDCTESEEHHRRSPGLSSKDRLHGLVCNDRKRIVIRTWTIVPICAVIACIIASAFLVTNHRHQKQLWRLYSLIEPDVYNFNTPKFGLNFPHEYPTLDTDRSTQACRNAWHSLTAVPCHERIWSRKWDYGHYDVLESDLNHFLPLICTEDCTEALIEAKSMLSNSCSPQNVFKFHGYEGRFNTTLLQPNPVAMMDVLVTRQTHDCHTSPIGDAERGYCMTDLQERWGILDGLMVEPLHGIDEFLLKTNQYKIEPAVRMLGMTGGKDWFSEHNYMREERMFGPGRGETTCSYCTLDWLGRKLKKWKPDSIYYEDGLPMELPVYIERISKAGRRCAGGEFTSMWADAIDHYEEQGLLDREGQWLRQPSGNKLYLFQHGPSPGDSPLPEIRDYLEQMGDWQSDHPYLFENESEELGHHTSCLQGLHEEILSMTCYPFLSIEDLASNVLDTPEHFRMSCTNDCRASIRRLRFKTFEACPELVSGRKRYRTPNGRMPFSLYDWREMIFSDSGSLESAENACGWNQENQSCDTVFAQLNMSSWITRTNIDAHKFERAVRVALATRPPRLSTNVPVWESTTDPDEPSKAEQIGMSERTENIEHTVCSPCVWQQFAGAEYWPKNLASLTGEKEISDWVRTMRILYDACAARAVTFDRSELQKITMAVLERIRNEVGNSVHRAGRPRKSEDVMAKTTTQPNDPTPIRAAD